MRFGTVHRVDCVSSFSPPLVLPCESLRSPSTACPASEGHRKKTGKQQGPKTAARGINPDDEEEADEPEDPDLLPEEPEPDPPDPDPDEEVDSA